MTCASSEALLRLLPPCLPLLIDWLSLVDIAQLDTACCNHALRGSVLSYLSTEVHMFLNLPDDLFVSDGFVRWLALRRLSVPRIPYSGMIQKSSMISLFDQLGPKLRTLVIPNFRQLDEFDLSDILAHGKHLQEFIVTNQEHGRMDYSGRLDFDDTEVCKSISNTTVQRIAAFCPRLKVLRVSYCMLLTAQSMQKIATSCPDLERLELNKCDRITDAALVAVAVGCRALKALLISACSRMTDESILALADNCPLLEELDCSETAEISSSALNQLFLKCSRLKSLNFRGCVNLREDAMLSIAQHCSLLQMLDLRECPRVSDQAVVELSLRCKLLQHLYIGDCTGITDRAVIAISMNCAQLKGLLVGGCVNVTNSAIVALAQTCSGLEMIDVGMNQKINDTSLIALARGCPSLRTVNASRCNNVSDSGIIAIAQRCPRLQFLGVSGCRGVSDRALLEVARCCPELYWLDIGGSNAITDLSVNSILRSCPLLYSIDLSLCPNITPAVFHGTEVADAAAAFAIDAVRCAVVNAAVAPMAEGAVDNAATPNSMEQQPPLLTREEVDAVVNAAATSMGLIPPSPGLVPTLSMPSMHDLTAPMNAAESIAPVLQAAIASGGVRSRSTSRGAEVPFLPPPSLVMSSVGSGTDLVSIGVAEGFQSRHGKLKLDLSEATDQVTSILIDSLVEQNSSSAMTTTLTPKVLLGMAGFHTGSTSPVPSLQQGDIRVRSRSASRGIETLNQPMFHTGTSSPAPPREIKVRSRSTSRGVEAKMVSGSKDTPAAVISPMSTSVLHSECASPPVRSARQGNGELFEASDEASKDTQLSMQGFVNAVSDALNKIYSLTSGGTPINQNIAAADVTMSSATTPGATSSDGPPQLDTAVLNLPFSNRASKTHTPVLCRSRSGSRGQDLPPATVSLFGRPPQHAAARSQGMQPPPPPSLMLPQPSGMVSALSFDSGHMSGTKLSTITEGQQIADFAAKSAADIASISSKLSAEEFDKIVAVNPFAVKEFALAEANPPSQEKTIESGRKDSGEVAPSGSNSDSGSHGVFGAPVFMPELVVNTAIVHTNSPASSITDVLSPLQHSSSQVSGSGSGLGSSSSAQLCSLVDLVGAVEISNAELKKFTADTSEVTFPHTEPLPSPLVNSLSAPNELSIFTATGNSASRMQSILHQNRSEDQKAVTSSHNNSKNKMPRKSSYERDASLVSLPSSAAGVASSSSADDGFVEVEAEDDGGWAVGSSFTPTVRSRATSRDCDMMTASVLPTAPSMMTKMNSKSGDLSVFRSRGNSDAAAIRSRGNSDAAAVRSRGGSDAVVVRSRGNSRAMRMNSAASLDKITDAAAAGKETAPGSAKPPPRVCSRIHVDEELPEIALSDEFSRGSQVSTEKADVPPKSLPEAADTAATATATAIAASTAVVTEPIVSNAAANQDHPTPTAVGDADDLDSEEPVHIPPAPKDLKLKRVKISGVALNNNATIMSICQFCPQLEILDLNGCVHVNDDALLAVAASCPKLQKLKLRCCRKISDSGVIGVVTSAKWPLILNLRLSSASNEMPRTIAQKYKYKAVLI